MRAGAAFLRLWDRTNLRLPSNLYSWLGSWGNENLVLGPLEAVQLSEADRKEAHWMRRWGLGGLQNRALPALQPGKWYSYSSATCRKQKSKHKGGGLLRTAVTVASQSAPLWPQQLLPPLMLTILSATRSVLEPAQHCALCKKVANCFMRHFRAHIPYRVPLNIPLVQLVMKSTLRKILHTVTDPWDYWPVHLREYIKNALVIVSKRSRKVGLLLASALTSRFPTAWLESDLTGPCPCQALPDTPRVAWSHGHAFFHDPAVLLTLCQECDTSMFEQNQRKSTIPS